jgi:hypothetical protein
VQVRLGMTCHTRALLRDYRDVGDKLWERFNQKDPQ